MAVGPTPYLGAGQGLAAPRAGVPTLVPVFDSFSDFCFGMVKIGTFIFSRPIPRIFPV